MDLKDFLERLIAGGQLTEAESSSVAASISSGTTDPLQVSAFLTLLAARGETPELVLGFSRELRSRAVKVEWPQSERPVCLVDVVGTGGDGHNSVNISTASAVVTAAFEGPSPIFVAKHGSVSVSSKSGSADVLLHLGVPHLKHPASVARCISECGIGFMFAPHFHPALKAVAPIRKALKVRTVFNILGPLLNPAGADRLVLGVYKPALLKVYAEAVAGLGAKHALIVHGHIGDGGGEGGGGADEFTHCGPNEVWEVRDGRVVGNYTVDTSTFPTAGISSSSLSAAAPALEPVPRRHILDLEGGTPEENAAIIRHVFAGAGASAASPPLPLVGHGDKARASNINAIRDAIALNAGACLYVAGQVASIEEGFYSARALLNGGKVLQKLEKWSATATDLHRGELSE